MRRLVITSIAAACLFTSGSVAAQPEPPPPDQVVAPPPPPRADAAAAPTPPTTSASAGASKPAESDEAKPSTPAEAGYVVPDSPALTLLEATTSAVDRPASPAKLALALINSVTAEGTLRAGVAIEASARALGITDRWNHYQYVHDAWRQFVARAALSFATTSDAATSTQPAQAHAAVGLRLVFFDQSDPLLDSRYRERVAYATNVCSKITDGQAQLDCQEKAYNDPAVPWGEARWNYGGAALAVAESFDFNDTKLANAGVGSGAVWATAAVGVDTWLQLAAGARYDRAWKAEIDRLAVSGKIRMGGEGVRAVIDGAYFAQSPKDPTQKRGRFSLGGEFKILNGTWLSVAFGSDVGAQEKASNVFVLSNLKWNLLDKASW